MTKLNDTSHFDRFEALISEFRALDSTEKEMNFFDVGVRGHFENPTTELLSFFLDPAKPHDLGDSFFKGLEAAIAKDKMLLDLGELESVETEVVTQNGKRIDLVVETENALIVIECKIYHHQNNPFDEYTTFGNNRISKPNQDSVPKKLIKLVLCLSGKISPDLTAKDWKGLSYNDLVQHIEQNLSITILNNPYNKWALFAREFLLHLKGLNTMTKINENEINFLTENLDGFAQLSDYIYNDLMPKIGEQIKLKLNASDLKDFNCKVKHSKWYYYEPVIRFSNLNWSTGSDIVLWLKANDSEVAYKINLHIGKQSDELTEQFKASIGDLWMDLQPEAWHEVNGYWGISWSFKTFDLEAVSEQMVELMRHLNDLELNYRTGLVENIDGE